jgi:hypothetical protein
MGALTVYKLVTKWFLYEEARGSGLEEIEAENSDEEAEPAPVLWKKRKWIAYGGRRHGQLEDEEIIGTAPRKRLASQEETGPCKRRRIAGIRAAGTSTAGKRSRESGSEAVTESGDRKRVRAGGQGQGQGQAPGRVDR